ncbi:hypothetical protein WCLP8_1080008 [uncultured Gammaproteobacteria bacterium]
MRIQRPHVAAVATPQGWPLLIRKISTLRLKRSMPNLPGGKPARITRLRVRLTVQANPNQTLVNTVQTGFDRTQRFNDRTGIALDHSHPRLQGFESVGNQFGQQVKLYAQGIVALVAAHDPNPMLQPRPTSPRRRSGYTTPFGAARATPFDEEWESHDQVAELGRRLFRALRGTVVSTDRLSPWFDMQTGTDRFLRQTLGDKTGIGAATGETHTGDKRCAGGAAVGVALFGPGLALTAGGTRAVGFDPPSARCIGFGAGDTLSASRLVCDLLQV